jgi:hypothetical protein
MEPPLNLPQQGDFKKMSEKIKAPLRLEKGWG